MLWESSISTDKILGAGVTIIGPVNQDEGIALHPFRLFEQAIPISFPDGCGKQCMRIPSQ